MKKFYIHNGQTEQGPLTIDEIKTLNLKTDTPIWHEGLEDWSKAGNIDELKEILFSQATPPPFNNNSSYKNRPPVYTDEEAPNKDRKTILYICLGILLLVVIGSWFIAQNNRTESILAAQQMQLDEQNAKELERQRINMELTRKNRNYRNNWPTYIQAGHNSYTYSVLGGITNLNIEVANSTDYLLDEVLVNVNYIKDNGGVWKTETVVINNIPANSSKSMPAPNSERGTSIQVEVVSIISKKMHFCYNSDMDIENPHDPFFCRL